MPSEKDVDPFPQFSSQVLEYCARSKIAFVRDAREALSLFLNLDIKVKNSYGWRFSSAEVIGEKLKEAKSVGELNRILWTDFVRNVEAYSVMTYWRCAEILKSSVRSINTQEYVSAAILARSFIELSATYLWNANVALKAVERLEFKRGIVVTSEELENYFVKAIWGTRLGSPEEHLLQKNVLTTIQKLSKNPAASDLLPTYEYLCEIAHPNVVGNARFWSHVEKVYEDGSELRVMGRPTLANESLPTLDKTIWAIAWGGAVSYNSFGMFRDATSMLLTKIESGCG